MFRCSSLAFVLPNVSGELLMRWRANLPTFTPFVRSTFSCNRNVMDVQLDCSEKNRSKKDLNNRYSNIQTDCLFDVLLQSQYHERSTQWEPGELFIDTVPNCRKNTVDSCWSLDSKEFIIGRIPVCYEIILAWTAGVSDAGLFIPRGRNVNFTASSFWYRLTKPGVFLLEVWARWKITTLNGHMFSRDWMWLDHPMEAFSKLVTTSRQIDPLLSAIVLHNIYVSCMTKCTDTWQALITHLTTDRA